MADESGERPDTGDVSEAHEGRDVNVASIVKFTGGLLVGIAASFVLMAILLRYLSRAMESNTPVSRISPPGDARLPPPPRLLAARGNRFKPEHFTDDPELQKELGEGEIDFELLPPERYREVYDQIKQRELATYGASAKQPGEFRIPIEEAKRLLLERGLAPLTAGAPQPGASPVTGQAGNQAGGQASDLPPGLPTAASSGRVQERREQ